MTELEIRFEATGEFSCLYDDEAMPYLVALGTWATQRASDVEPLPDGFWSAVLRPWVGAPTAHLGVFGSRTEALQAERDALLTLL